LPSAGAIICPSLIVSLRLGILKKDMINSKKNRVIRKTAQLSQGNEGLK
jgi:hypothetical protein